MPSECSKEQFAAQDGRTLTCHHWQPSGAIRARAILLHGIESHAQWFEGTCRWLARLGFEIFAPERRGSGEDCDPGSLQRGDVDSYRTWLQDVECLAQRLRAQKPQLKLHLMGISWGGKLACAAAALSGVRPDSLLLITPGIAPLVSVSWAKKCAIAWSAAFAPGRRFDLPIADAGMFTASDRWQRFIDGDVLRLKLVTARFLAQNHKLDRLLRRAERCITAPMLLLLAGRDRIIDNAATRRRVESFASERKKIVEYPDAVHTLEFEDNPDLWRKDVLAWLDSF